jgi:hypothetical protein
MESLAMARPPARNKTIARIQHGTEKLKPLFILFSLFQTFRDLQADKLL